WIERMSIVRNITAFLLRHPDRHFGDLRRQQFVMFNNEPMLIDFGDVKLTADRTATSLHHARRIYDDFLDNFERVGAPGDIDRELDELELIARQGLLTVEKIQSTIDGIVK
ncbi:hypothetical protein PFISCL1PPCAC_3788, partial [Pristionchus fissidentatus]